MGSDEQGLDLTKLFGVFTKTPGAVSCTEAAAVIQTIDRVQPVREDGALIVYDFGSHAGKMGSALCAAVSFKAPVIDYYAVDPLYSLGSNDEVFKDTVQKCAENVPWNHARDPKFKDNVRAALTCAINPKCEVETFLVGHTSLDLLRGVRKTYPPADVVFIDSDDHQEELVRAELDELRNQLKPGALVFFHDFGNQYHGPKNAYDYVVEEWKWTPIEIDAGAARAAASKWDKDNDSWHMPGEDAPCYVGCLQVT